MIKRTTLIILITLLTACSSTPEQVTIPTYPVDPTDEQLKESIAQFLTTQDAPAATRYSFQRIDLNTDKRRDALIFLHAPYGYWCGVHGCTMLVFKANNASFQLLNTVQPIRAPVYVSELETNGWKNLIVRVSGRQNSAKNVALQFNGRNYPANPKILPAYAMSLVRNPSHTRVFNEYNY